VQAAIDERAAQQALHADAQARDSSAARRATRARAASDTEQDDRDAGVPAQDSPATKRPPRPRTSGRPATA
jgi:hypothetical protein